MESLAPWVDQLGAGSFAEVKYLLPAVARLYDVLFHFEESGGDVSLLDFRRSFAVLLSNTTQSKFRRVRTGTKFTGLNLDDSYIFKSKFTFTGINLASRYSGDLLTYLRQCRNHLADIFLRNATVELPRIDV